MRNMAIGWLPLALAFTAGCREDVPESRAERAASAENRSSAADTTALVARGRYLVSHVAMCGDCHTPAAGHGRLDEAKWLSGVDCFVDVVPDDPGAGCIATANLTNHATGLLNRTDGQIKDMFLRGVRPDGKALHPFMPYAFFGNMTEADADAIVKYLRTVPGVDHTVARSQPPFLPPAAPRARVPDTAIPLPRPEYAEREAALRGRYLATKVGVCMDCHTPRGKDGPALERAFQGGMKFGRRQLGLPDSFPELVHSANLTPHASGILAYGVADVVRALKHGEDKHQDGAPLCAPMPAGPKGSLAGLTDQDAADIGHYLLSLPPADNAVPDCRPPLHDDTARSTRARVGP